MARKGEIWLVYNRSSGSNDEAALAELETALAGAGFSITGRTCFPDDAAPGVENLRSSGADCLAVFAGDGTVNSVVTGLFGWEGAVLVLPGGTMNMLSRRLHGDSEPELIVERLAAGHGRTVRPAIIRSRLGDGLSGVIAGPGTVWNDVREAMRHADVLDFVGSTIEAITASTDGPRVKCHMPARGRDGGYPAITIVPGEDGLTAEGYYAETLADRARHGAAILQQDFRSGPHETLCVNPLVELASIDGEPMGLLIDGEPHEGGAREKFVLARCEVDLLATGDAI